MFSGVRKGAFGESLLKLTCLIIVIQQRRRGSQTLSTKREPGDIDYKVKYASV